MVNRSMKMNIELLKKFANTLSSKIYQLKEIELTMFSNFSTIDFIEDLHKDESIEDEGVVKT